ncbi:Leucine-rich repeat protein kinase family protein [Striga hermonthica]|uniref:Leucine-rich repeat protein kinase family protein n=1 Tax=Striga hermonthica TaxID=68872 RepID=A0A9N7N966_STRHE|nr:Leucine-rich repeat protein kinase family protein [Striga hermonthica]
MGNSRTSSGTLVLLILVLEIHGCWSINSEGLALLQFQANVAFDPYGALADWVPDDCDPCLWSGVECLDSKVVMLNLTGRGLEGALAPDLANLSHLRVLDLSKNCLSGTIPPQFGQLTKLEVLDLRDNDLSGRIPADLGELKSLSHLLLCNNRFEGRIPVEIEKLGLLKETQFDDILTTAAGNGCVNRKFGHCTWQGTLEHSENLGSFRVPNRWSIIHYLRKFTQLRFGHGLSDNHADSFVPPNVKNNVRRVLAEQSSNLIALPPDFEAPPPSESGVSLPSRSSGSFPAVPNAEKLSPAPLLTPPSGTENTTPHAISQTNDGKGPSGNSGHSTKVIIGISCAVLFLLVFPLVLFAVFRSRAARTIRPWKSGLSGQLQKAFITGVPKLNRAELETACEDFSNIIRVYDGVSTLYKGTLSSGVEIAVVSTAVGSINEWSKRAELAFRKKIDCLSRVNHKNFVNLIGYCEEDEPFTRMMVFEYAPNGTLFEHLHEDLEHLDWNARTRIMMGAAYCLQYMHELNPPVAHINLTSKEIYLTDDYAAKIADVGFWLELMVKSKNKGESESDHSELPPLADVETNIHSFGMLLLEIISGMLPHSAEKSNLADWTAQYLYDKTISKMVDPTLKSFNEKELEVVCEVIKCCIHQEPRKRPSMKEIIQKLREVIDVSPEAATPRLSPLWWAELEILSAEAA